LKRINSLLLLLVLGILIAAGGLLQFKKVTLLLLENLDDPRTVQIPIRPTEVFSIFYTHSVLNEPAIEEFRVEGEAIVLKGLRTKSPAIMEYYGHDTAKDFQPLNQRLGAIFFRWGTGTGQGLVVRERKIYLSEIGKRGDRIRLRVKRVTLGSYLYSVIAPPKELTRAKEK
jgi:hypothetical protein